MMGPTHRALAVTTATGLSVGTNAIWKGSVSPDAAGVIIGSAWIWGCLPDQLERWLRKWPLRLLRIPTDHRTWTHWLLTTVLMGVTVGAIVYGIGQGVAALAAGPNEADLRDVAKGGGYVFGVLIGLGALCGTVSHALADACTDGGSTGVPLLGPWKRDGVWLMPKGMRCKVNPAKRDRHGNVKKDRKGNEKRAMSLGEHCWHLGAWAATGLMIYLGVA